MLLDLVRDELLSPLRLIDALSTRPAKIGRFESGGLAVGAPADLALIDPDAEWTLDVASLCSRSSNTPYLDKPMRGRTVMTVVGGEVVYES